MPPRPNIILFFTDQHRKQSLGFMGEDPVITPRLDRFARQGLVFTSAVSNLPICSPFRAMLLTGRYPHHNNVAGNCNSTDPRTFLRESERCLSDVLHDAGYDCGYIGKWHLDCPKGPRTGGWQRGNWDAYTPPRRRHGFNFWHSYGCMFDYMHPHFWGNRDPERKPARFDRWEVAHEADVAIRYIRNRGGRTRERGKPFLLCVAPHQPHPPVYPVPKKYLDLYNDTPVEKLLNRPNLGFTGNTGNPHRAHRIVEYARRIVRGYFACVSSIDEHFGRILDCLGEEGLERDTIVVFTSDHGEMLGSQGLDAKSAFFEESAGIPFIIRWPGRIRPGREAMPLSTPDVMPTLLGLAGMGGAIPRKVEGTDYSRLVRGLPQERAGGALLFRGARPCGLRTERHLLEYGGKRDRLFDLRNDPYEMKDIAGEEKPLVQRLKAMARGMERRLGLIE